MALLHLVRHGQAAAGYGDDPDPGLDDEGRRQAQAVADALAALGPLPILVSPLRRCRETAVPLSQRWGIDAQVEPAIAEVAAPVAGLAERSAWLRRAMAGGWVEVEDEPRVWRETLLERVRSVETDTVLVTHFVAINAVIGAATGDDRVLVERLANGSITTIEQRDGMLQVVRAGSSGSSEVL
jgi:broad specificity phosphatase PhoE